MYFSFGMRKIVEAAVVLLQASPRHRMGVMRFLKLLYIADRESFRETGRPIIGTRPVAMDLGPIHSNVYDLVKGFDSGDAKWDEFIQKIGNDVKLKKAPEVLVLSRYEMDKLGETVQRYREVSDTKLVDITHTFPEWIKNHKGRTSKPIPMKDILEAVGRGAEESEILKDAKHVRAINALFGTIS